MSGIRSRNTRPEKLVRSMLHASGFRFRLHERGLPGRPDIVMRGRRVVVFVHGCFWHRHSRCVNSKLPSTRGEFWKAKLEGNAKRDRKSVNALLAQGWRVLVIWECAVRRRRDGGAALRAPLLRWMASTRKRGELGAPTLESGD